MSVQTDPHASNYDVIVIGAGVLGSALATTLGRQQRRVLLIERDYREPDRIVGELLQPGGVRALEKLGLRECLDDIDAIAVHGYAVFDGKDPVELPYPKDSDSLTLAEGRSFHHGRFVRKLRQAALNTAAVTCLEGSASSLIYNDSRSKVVGVVVNIKQGDVSISREFYSPLTVAADGCFSKFRKSCVSKPVESKSSFAGLVLKDVTLPFPNHGHVILAKPSPILLYQIGTHDTRILVDIPGKMPSAVNGDLRAYMVDVVKPQLPEQVQAAFVDAVDRERIRSMPNSWLPPSTNNQEGFILVGDAMNMRHPLTGGGMTVALWDVVHLTDLISPSKIPALTDSKAILNAMQSLHWRRKNLSSVINILAQALYDLFAAGDNLYLKELQIACFKYFKLGGRCVTTPVGLLAGLIPSPPTLLAHFFAVAFYGMYNILRRSTSPVAFVMNVVKCFWVLVTACRVIGPVVVSELMP